MQKISKTEMVAQFVIAQAGLVASLQMADRINSTPRLREAVWQARELDRMRAQSQRYIPSLAKLDGWRELLNDDQV